MIQSEVNPLTKNSFLTKEEQELQKLAYFGEFLVLSDFDDGWKCQMQKQLLEYLVSLDFSGEDSKINLEVEKEINEEKGEIFAILKSESLNTETEEKILEISTLLQKKYYMTPVQQKVGFGASENTSLPIKLEELTDKDFGYERLKFQRQYSDILDLGQKLKNISHYISIKNSLGDEISLILVSELEKLRDTYLDEISTLKKSLNKINSDLYDSLAIKTILKGENEDTVIFDKTGLEKLKDDDNFIENNKSEIDFSKHSLGKIGECTVDRNGYIISAKLLDSDKNIYYDDSRDETMGFHLEGFGSIKYLKPLEYNEDKEVILLKAYIGNSAYYYYLENGNYMRFQLDETYVNLNLKDYVIDKTTGKPLYGKASTVKLESTLFWIEDGEYKIIENIAGYTDIENTYNVIRDQNGKPLYGKAYVGYETRINFILDEKTGRYIKKKLFMKNPYKK